MSKQTFLEISADYYQEVVEAIAHQRGYRKEVQNPDFDPEAEVSASNSPRIDNPEGKEDFAKSYVLEVIKRDLVNYKVGQAQTEAGQAEREKLESIVL